MFVSPWELGINVRLVQWYSVEAAGAVVVWRYVKWHYVTLRYAVLWFLNTDRFEALAFYRHVRCRIE